MRSKFANQVIGVIKSVPAGRVVSYGQVAAYADKLGAARAVGWLLRQTELPDLPWWRVINNAGRISIKNMFHQPEEQRRLLREEGVEGGEDFSLDIEKYRWFHLI